MPPAAGQMACVATRLLNAVRAIAHLIAMLRHNVASSACQVSKIVLWGYAARNLGEYISASHLRTGNIFVTFY
jgi:hypothetical protein